MVILVVTLYFVVSLCVTVLRLSGELTDGTPMFFDLQIPSWTALFPFQIICVLILCFGFKLRGKFLK